jgi:hypothetical protein
MLPTPIGWGEGGPTTSTTRRNGETKTSIWLPDEIWRAAKIRAVDEHTDFRRVLIAALEGYLKTPLPKRPTARKRGGKQP